MSVYFDSWYIAMRRTIILLIALNSISAWKYFHRGRVFGGNLGKPYQDYEQNAQMIHNPHVSQEWFNQKLDHSNPNVMNTWKQRFHINDEYFNGSSNSPVFLMIGGEGETSILWMSDGAWIQSAKQFGALCFQLEHRFYGKSHPTPDLSTKNLRFLTSEQALDDLAYFITSMNERFKLTSDNKWIAFGGSYPGSLAAWLRAKYPHLVHGAMSASGPLLAQIDFLNYFRVVDEALTMSSEDCLTAVQKGTHQIGMLITDQQGLKNLSEKFKLCNPLEIPVNQLDIANLYETLAGNFAGVVQYNKDNRQGSRSITIDTICEIMTNADIGPQVDRLAQVNKLILRSSDQTCLDYQYGEMINELRKVSWDEETAEGGRQWMYQTCTEFGFFQSSDYKPQVFGDAFPAEFFIQQCVDTFGMRYNASFLEDVVSRTNINYGGMDIDVSNVVFVHGSIDPWHALGITKTLEQNAPAIYIEGTAHCANMYAERDEDLPALKAARVEVNNLIDSWLRL